MRFRRRKAAPVAERAAAGVLWRMLCFFVSLSGTPDTKLRHTTVCVCVGVGRGGHP